MSRLPSDSNSSSPRAWSETDRRNRVILVVLAATSALVGTYATTLPHSFYVHALGVRVLGAYDQHLVSDLGGFYLGFALLFGWAARAPSPRLGQAVCAAFALVQAQHVAYHALHLNRFTFTEGLAEMLGLGVVLALALIAAALGSRGRTGAR